MLTIILDDNSSVTVPLDAVAKMQYLVMLADKVEPTANLANNYFEKRVHVPQLTYIQFTEAFLMLNTEYKRCDADVLRILGVTFCKSNNTTETLQKAILPAGIPATAHPIPPQHAMMLTKICNNQSIASNRVTDISDDVHVILNNYSASIVTIQGTRSMSGDIEFNLKCPETEYANYLHTFVLKVYMPPLPKNNNNHDVLHWTANIADELFKSVLLVISDSVVEEIPLSVNNILARFANLCVTDHILYDNANASHCQMLTIPLMLTFTVTPKKPLQRAAWQKGGAKVILKNVIGDLRRYILPIYEILEPLKIVAIELAIESIVVPSTEHYTCACSECALSLKTIEHIKYCKSHTENVNTKFSSTNMPVENVNNQFTTNQTSNVETLKEPLGVIKSVMTGEIGASCSIDYTIKYIPIHSVQCKEVALEFSKDQNCIQRIPLHDFLNKSCWGVMIAITRDNVIGHNPTVLITALTLVIDGRQMYKYDYQDLYIWNWLKVGMDVPNNAMNFCLVPFSRFYNTKHRATINFAKTQVSELQLELNPAMSIYRCKITIIGKTMDTVPYKGN